MELKKLRENKGWTLEQLAREAKVSQPTVSRIENGKPVGRIFVARVCNALGVNINDIEGLNIRD